MRNRIILAIALAAALAVTIAAGATRPVVAPPPEGCTVVIDVEEVWANFQPNDSQATFIGPAIYPTDPRGSWTLHDKIPGGHAGPDGVYSKGNPAKGGNWFYRQAEVSHVECPEEPPTCEEDPTQEGCEPIEPPPCELVDGRRACHLSPDVPSIRHGGSSSHHEVKVLPHTE